ncbi:transglycosylase domain-containing protein [Sandarakinorhabdus oryzae]|uniref:transglycosylase domain-containing protein n=1 Tax=Sandarakinorhabdus oryzae TaxID=2675220 RepID=UPI001F1F5EB2|nr:PBP1A family penicillin-binding protein [Sandarakinorhabdus oryzae]
MPQRRPAPRPKKNRWYISLLKWGLVGGLAVFIALAVAVALAYRDLPSFEAMKKSPNGQPVEIRGDDGAVLASFGPSYGEWLSYTEIPATMKAAMIAVEDKRYWYHPGVDPIGIVRSIVVNAAKGDRAQGASTITQQLARNLFLTSSKDYTRKLREMVLALAIERKFAKEDILELYLNRVYFGGGAYGIDAASRKFYGHSARRLSLEEAAIIAGLVKAPSRFSPSADAEAARKRAATVIAVMVDNGAISEAEAAAADPRLVRFAPQARAAGVRYFTDWVLSELENLTDEVGEPLLVETTLNAQMQRQAEAAIRAEAPRGAQGALVALARDGGVKAMVGGTDYVRSNYNRAIVARRQPGSAFKFFVYVAALESGVTPDDMVEDRPVTIGNWSPKNNNGTFAGPVSVRQAFAQSINTVAVQLAQQVGFDTVADVARRFGITTAISREPAMALGSSVVTLFEMTNAYATVANNGLEQAPYAITRITTGTGRVLYNRSEGETRQVVAPVVAAQMTQLMQAAVEEGTARAAQIGRPLAGKTGTTSSNKDGWFIGFSSGITTGVWMGRDDNQAVRGLAGGRAPARAFAQFMARAVGGTPPEPLVTDVTEEGLGPEPDAQSYGITMDEPPPMDGEEPPASDPPRLDDNWLDKTLNEPAQQQPAPH